MLKTIIMQLVTQRAQLRAAGGGAMLECLTPTESICLNAVGSLEHRDNSRGPLSRNLAQESAYLVAPLLCNDVILDPRIDSTICRELGVHALISVALRWRPDELGVLTVVNGVRAFTDADVHTLDVLLDLLSSTVVNTSDEPVRVMLTGLGESGYQQVLDAISDMVLVKGPRSRIVWANQAFRDVYGMSNDQLRGLIDAEFSEPDTTLKYVQDDARVFSSGKILDIPDEPVVCHDGTALSCHTVKSPIVNSNGKVIMTVGVSRDITERKQAGEELRLHRERLEVLVRERTTELEVAKVIAENANSAKSAFLANMSHELRTPMHAVLAYTRLCLDQATEPTTRDFLNRIASSGERLLLLLNALLDLSKLQAEKMEVHCAPQDVEMIAREVALEMEPLICRKRLSVKFERAPTCTSCLAVVDRKHIAQAFYNILANAVRFSPDGGRIGIRFANAVLPPGSVDDAETRRPALEIAFSDEGVGIPEAELESIFSQFVQSSRTRDNAGGSGLGLAICREIVALHHGTLRAQNNETCGCTFVMRLPLELPISDAQQDRRSQLERFVRSSGWAR